MQEEGSGRTSTRCELKMALVMGTQAHHILLLFHVFTIFAKT